MAFQFTSINSLHPLTRAVARAPVARQPSSGQWSAHRDAALGLAGASTSTSPPATTPPTTPASGGNPLFPIVTTSPAPPASSAAAAPTPQSVFGANPWLSNPTGSGPTGVYTYNPYYFASPQTAAKVASMVGGQVVEVNACSGGSRFVQNQPNQMVQLPNGAMINPGLVASFYTHGYPQSMVDQMIANEVANVTKGT